MLYPLVNPDWETADVKREEDNLTALFGREMRKKPFGAASEDDE